jgi:hypothetical protein
MNKWVKRLPFLLLTAVIGGLIGTYISQFLNILFGIIAGIVIAHNIQGDPGEMPLGHQIKMKLRDWFGPKATVGFNADYPTKKADGSDLNRQLVKASKDIGNTWRAKVFGFTLFLTEGDYMISGMFPSIPFTMRDRASLIGAGFNRTIIRRRK